MQFAVVEAVLSSTTTGSMDDATTHFLQHVETIVKNSVQMCSGIKSQRSEELWLQVIQLLDNFRMTLRGSHRQSPMIEHRPIFVETVVLMMWSAVEPDTRQVALEGLLDILVKAKSRELPMQMYLQHFSTLVRIKSVLHYSYACQLSWSTRQCTSTSPS
jgi:hypothetical protein